jgi:hypothetical protein
MADDDGTCCYTVMSQLVSFMNIGSGLHTVASDVSRHLYNLLGQVQGFRLTQHWFEYFIYYYYLFIYYILFITERRQDIQSELEGGKTLWPESASELYRPSGRRLSTKLV